MTTIGRSEDIKAIEWQKYTGETVITKITIMIYWYFLDF